jgi:Tol biopolymer transport system component
MALTPCPPAAGAERLSAHPEVPVPRPARPDDLYRLLVPFDPRLSPDGRIAAFTVKRTAIGRDAYRHSIWLAPTDGSAPARQVSLGARSDRQPRFSPDGRALAFISDRRLLVEEEPDRPKEAKDRLDCDQVFLLPLDGGEARRLTDLPGVTEIAWSPDGATLAILTSRSARR